eukprot:3186902-Prymnesium_polylepis.1
MLGSFCPQGASAALPCPSGRFGGIPDLSAAELCHNCTAGSLCITGSIAPKSCAAGSFQPNEGSSSCTYCQPGHFQNVMGSLGCFKCPDRTYASISGAVECNNCLARTSSYPASAECDVCDVHFYRLDAQTEANQTTCIPCPEKGAACPMDTTLETIIVLPGHWRLSGWSRVITRCVGNTAAERCVGGPNASGTAASVGRILTSTVVDGDAPNINGDDYCGPIYSGPECLLCRGGQGLYMHEDSGQCRPCPEFGDRLALLIGIAAPIAVGAGACVVAYFHPAGQRFAAVQSARRMVAWLISYAEPVGFQAKLKSSLLHSTACPQQYQQQPWVPCTPSLDLIPPPRQILFSFYGIATVLDTTFDAHMPEAYTSWISDAFGWARVNWPSLLLPSECTPFSTGSSFRSWLLVKGVTPLVLIFVAVVGATIFRSARLGWSRKSLLNGCLQAVPLALLLSFGICPSVTMSIFQSFLCVEYQFDDRDAYRIETHQYLREDLSVRCSHGGFSNSEYDTIGSTAYVLIAIW